MRFAPKREKKANINENIETLNFSVLYGKLRFPPQIQLFFQNHYSDQTFCRFRTGWTSIIVFCARKREKANINEIIETFNFSVLCANLQFPPQIYLFFQNSYSDQIFCRFKTGWTSMFAYCAKKRKKANINENIETLYFSVLYGKLRFPPQIQFFFQNTYSDQTFCRFRTGWTSIIVFWAKKQEKTNIIEIIETFNFSVLCASLQFPPQIYLFFQNTYSDQIFCRFRTGWTSMFAFCAKKEKKANINENMETLNYSVLYGKLRFPPQYQLFFQNTYSDQIFCRFRTGWTRIFAFCAKYPEKQTLTKTLGRVRKILASYTENCNFRHKSNSSSKTLILTNFFADSELLGLVYLRFAPKREKRQTLTKTLRL